MVAVRMVSEGVDVPRLAVGVYATSASTPLYFAQAIGRFVRARRPGETASVFLPSVPMLLQLASELEVQRNHVLGNRTGRPTSSVEAQASGRAGRVENGFVSLGADAELDQVIFDGASFGTATPRQRRGGRLPRHPRSLDAAQMRALLRRHQEQQFDRRAAGARPLAGYPARTTA